MADETALSSWLRREMPRRGYPLEGPRAGGITRLADDAEISRASMSRIVSGQAEASVDALRKIGRVFGLSLGEMMVVAGLAEPAEVRTPGPADDDETASTDRGEPAPQRRGHLEVHDGGPLSEEQVWEYILRDEDPPEPPGGWSSDHITAEGERALWAVDYSAYAILFDPKERHQRVWSAKLAGLRDFRANRARERADKAAERARRGQQDPPRDRRRRA